MKYALLDDPARIDPSLAGKKVSTIIWTTTPWTLPASMAGVVPSIRMKNTLRSNPVAKSTS